MEELLQALVCGGRTVTVEYTGDLLLRVKVCGKPDPKIPGEVRKVLVMREGPTVMAALRDCAIVLMMGVESTPGCACDCLPCQSCDHR